MVCDGSKTYLSTYDTYTSSMRGYKSISVPLTLEQQGMLEDILEEERQMKQRGGQVALLYGE